MPKKHSKVNEEKVDMARLEKFMDSFGKFKKRDLVILFWFSAISTIPIFAYIYGFLLVPLIGLVSLPFGLSSGVISKVTLSLSAIFAVLTQIMLWRQLKKHFLK